MTVWIILAFISIGTTSMVSGQRSPSNIDVDLDIDPDFDLYYSHFIPSILDPEYYDLESMDEKMMELVNEITQFEPEVPIDFDDNDDDEEEEEDEKEEAEEVDELIDEEDDDDLMDEIDYELEEYVLSRRNKDRTESTAEEDSDDDTEEESTAAAKRKQGSRWFQRYLERRRKANRDSTESRSSAGDDYIQPGHWGHVRGHHGKKRGQAGTTMPEPQLEVSGDTFLEGEKLKMRCFVRVPLATTVHMEWNRKGSERVFISEPVRVSGDSGGWYRYDKVESELTIHDIIKTDQGVYRCTVTNHEQKTNFKETTIDVIGNHRGHRKGYQSHRISDGQGHWMGHGQGHRAHHSPPSRYPGRGQRQGRGWGMSLPVNRNLHSSAAADAGGGAWTERLCQELEHIDTHRRGLPTLLYTFSSSSSSSLMPKALQRVRGCCDDEAVRKGLGSGDGREMKSCLRNIYFKSLEEKFCPLVGNSDPSSESVEVMSSELQTVEMNDSPSSSEIDDNDNDDGGVMIEYDYNTKTSDSTSSSSSSSDSTSENLSLYATQNHGHGHHQGHGQGHHQGHHQGQAQGHIQGHHQNHNCCSVVNEEERGKCLVGLVHHKAMESRKRNPHPSTTSSSSSLDSSGARVQHICQMVARHTFLQLIHHQRDERVRGGGRDRSPWWEEMTKRGRRTEACCMGHHPAAYESRESETDESESSGPYRNRRRFHHTRKQEVRSSSSSSDSSESSSTAGSSRQHSRPFYMHISNEREVLQCLHHLEHERFDRLCQDYKDESDSDDDDDNDGDDDDVDDDADDDDDDDYYQSTMIITKPPRENEHPKNMFRWYHARKNHMKRRCCSADSSGERYACLGRFIHPHRVARNPWHENSDSEESSEPWDDDSHDRSDDSSDDRSYDRSFDSSYDRSDDSSDDRSDDSSYDRSFDSSYDRSSDRSDDRSDDISEDSYTLAQYHRTHKNQRHQHQQQHNLRDDDDEFGHLRRDYYRRMHRNNKDDHRRMHGDNQRTPGRGRDSHHLQRSPSFPQSSQQQENTPQFDNAGIFDNVRALRISPGANGRDIVAAIQGGDQEGGRELPPPLPTPAIKAHRRREKSRTKDKNSNKKGGKERRRSRGRGKNRDDTRSKVVPGARTRSQVNTEQAEHEFTGSVSNRGNQRRRSHHDKDSERRSRSQIGLLGQK